ncbi:hypothetical protein F4778DRAFT_711864 [Xylariomycetidae sp. FL2044]|nr:hypothetical protein F4778DRAFT_711864 [Xylariomycetidae sp. FL2044]
MTGSKDLPHTDIRFFPNVFVHNQFRAKTQWPHPDVDLSGQVAIVTGSNSGLGYEASLQLLGLKLSKLIMGVRSIEKGQAAATTMRQTYPQANIEVWPLDMSSYASVQSFAARVEAELPRIDIVILNAGLAHIEYVKCESTGHEEIFQVNYLSTILLAVLLLPVLRTKRKKQASGSQQQQKPARLTISSAALTFVTRFAQRGADPLFPALDDPRNFTRETYPLSKLLAQMFLWNLVDYVSADDVVVNLADPAFVRGTRLSRDAGTFTLARAVIYLFGRAAGRTPKVGASCYIDAVVNHGKESHGCFLMSWTIHQFPPLLYTDEGQKVIQRVWEETLAELEFANVRKIIESLKSTES